MKGLRLERKLSQEALANSAHVSSGYLSKLERGLYREPSYEVLSRIAGALQVPTADLYIAAGLEHLIAESDPELEPVMEPYEQQLSDLPRRDRQIIMTEIRRIFIEEGSSDQGEAE